MTFEELAETLGIRNKTLRMAFSRHHLSIGKPADIQSFLAQRFSGKRRHRAARPKQTAQHLQQWQFRQKAVGRIKDTGLRIKISEEEITNLTAKLVAAETNRKEADLRLQQLEAEKIKLEETEGRIKDTGLKVKTLEEENSNLAAKLVAAEKQIQALEMQLQAAESISQAQGKIIESLKGNKEYGIEKAEAKEVAVASNQGNLAEENVETTRWGVSTPEEIPVASAAEIPPKTEETPHCHSCEGRNPEKEKQIEVEEKKIPTETAETKAAETLAEEVAAKVEAEVKTETPAAAEVFAEIPEERIMDTGLKIQPLEDSTETTTNETADKPVESEAKEILMESNEEKLPEEKAEAVSPPIEESENPETQPTESAEVIPAEIPVEAQSETVEAAAQS